MNVDYFKKGKVWLLVFLLLIVGGTNARADVRLTDHLTLTGFARQTAVVGIGHRNPYLTKKPDFNLIRSLFQVELDYRPTDVFRLYMKGRLTYDQTYMLQSKVHTYDTTPWTADHNGLDLQTGYGEDTLQAQIWEAWANIETNLLWVRLGKQQIAWGDLPGVRIADKINPLDKSWHLNLEPEEYENIRIPEWSTRVYFTLPETMSGPFDEVFIDTYVNPGDIHPDIQPAVGSPYQNAFSTVDGDENFDERGETEWGARVGFNVGQFQTTFNYMATHNDFPVWDVMASGPPNFTKYPDIKTYAMTLSYAFNWPIGTSMTFEGAYTPDQPWQDITHPPGPPKKEEAGFYRTAIYLERDVFLLNSLTRFFYPGKIGFMYYRHWLEEEDTVKLTPAPLNVGNKLDWTMNMFYLSYTQGFGEGKSWEINPKVYWVKEGSYKIQCFLKYEPNYDWRFDLGGMWQGGSSARAFMYPQWNDELYLRVTYMF